MIDIHNHILPDLDDGSLSVEMSLNMLRTAFDQGISDVVNTVHLQHPKVEGRDVSYDVCWQKLDELNNTLTRENIEINIHLASEIFYLPNLLEISSDPIATFNKKYMLIEFQTHSIPDSHWDVFFNLKMEGITPIIAHPERYKVVQGNLDYIVRWLEMGCVIQVNAGSITGIFGKSCNKTAMKILENNYCQVIASDAHNDGKRNFSLKKAALIYQNVYNKSADNLVKINPSKIIQGEPLNMDYEIQNPVKKRGLFKKIIERIR